MAEDAIYVAIWSIGWQRECMSTVIVDLDAGRSRTFVFVRGHGLATRIDWRINVAHLF